MEVGDTRELVICIVAENKLFGLDDRRELNTGITPKAHGLTVQILMVWNWWKFG